VPEFALGSSPLYLRLEALYRIPFAEAGALLHTVITFFRRYSKSMKTQIALFGGTEGGLNATLYQFEKAFAGKSAFERSVSWAHAFFPTLVLTDSATDARARELAPAGVTVLSRPAWDASELLTALSEHCKQGGVDTLLFAFAASPFLDTELTERLLDHHHKYMCEYTFADGYAGGLAPVVIEAHALETVAELARKNFAGKPVTSNILFEVIKTDINAFEVESVIAPEDVRAHRFDFSCVSKRTLEVCKNLYAAAKAGGGVDSMSAAALGHLASVTESVKRTIPSFYAVQVSAWTPTDTIYSPYNPHRKDTMELANFASLVKDIAALSGEAVVSLSAWGEPLSHPDFASLVANVLAEPGLSVLIETNGAPVTAELAAKCAEIAQKAGKRSNGHEPIYWIVAIDAMDEAKYREIHPLLADATGIEAPTLEKARRAVDILEAAFPGAVYAQWTRMNENEDQLESFYRTYNKRETSQAGIPLIQKYDRFCGLLPDRRPADLSPLDRNPCWHLLRDMVILLDGSVPVCRECGKDNVLGNVFTDGPDAVWKRGGKTIELCKECDEYYTFNF
jgi:spiro-SPASM protein